MRSKTESRRCGCGVILSLRESCARCAAAARSRLHEAGVATMRGQESCRHARWRISEDRCETCGIGGNAARRQGRHPFAKQRYGVERDLFGSGEQRVVRYTREQLQAVSKQVFGDGWGDRLKAHQHREQAAVAALFRYLALFAADPYRKVLEHAKRERFCAQIGDEQDLWNRVNERIAALKLPAKHEPPAVGAEVPWEQAKADMMAREGAVYRRATEGTVVYKHSGGTLVCYLDCRWRTSALCDDDCRRERWVRLA